MRTPLHCLHYQHSRRCQRGARRWVRVGAVVIAMAVMAPVRVAPRASADDGVYDDKVWVEAETRLDWAYPLVGKSPAEPPLELLEVYKSTALTYELFGPAEPPAGGKLPLVLFASPQDRPVAWRFWEETCRTHGVVFASARDMGNGHPMAQRVRAALDVLDDVRSRFPIDADRTYLVGFSGGAHVACTIAFALPEYFGGVLSVGYAPQPPRSPWQLARVRDRLSLAIINGEHDPATPLTEDLFIPWWESAGVRLEPVTLRRRGHTMPEPAVFEAAFAWLEAGVAERRAAAGKRPALRIGDAPKREECADRVLADAQAQLAAADAASIETGLSQLEGLVDRWADVPAAAIAKQLLADYSGRADRPWDAVRAEALRNEMLLQAEGFDALAHDGRAPVRDQRARHAENASAIWEQLRDDSEDAEFVARADERIAALAKIAASAPTDSKAELVPLRRVRFDMNGDVTLREGIEHMRQALARVGYNLQADEAALHAAGVDLDKPCKPRIRAGTLEDIDKKFFRRAGVRIQRVENVIEILPVTSR